MDPVTLYDHLTLFTNDNTTFDSTPISENETVLLEIISQLSIALEKRIVLITSVKVPTSSRTLCGIGIKLDGTYSEDILTKGPPSGLNAGDAFREFWGDKAELRRMDGDLHECVLWSPEKNVVQQIIDYVLNWKFKSFSSTISWRHITPNRLNKFLGSLKPYTTASAIRLIRAMDRLRELLRGMNDKLPLNITGVLPVSSAFRDTAVFPPTLNIPSSSSRKEKHAARKRNKSVENLDNDVSDERFALKYPVFPLYVIITLEQSGKWPNQLEAFMHMKRLLVIRLHELLSPIGIPSHVTQDNMLDIFLDGLVFRVSIAQPRELQLLQSSVVPTPLSARQQQKSLEPSALSHPGDSSAPTTSSAAAWLRLNRQLPTIAGMLASVARSHVHVFPIACRLAKRWLSTHGYPVILCPFEEERDGRPLLDHDFVTYKVPQEAKDKGKIKQTYRQLLNTSHALDPTENGARLTEVAVELLVLHSAGLTDSPKSSATTWNGPTASPVVAFLRFLALLARHNWEREPLLVDLNEGFSDFSKRRVALDCLQQYPSRDQLPPMVLCTPLDLTGTEWTSVGLTRPGLQQLRSLAEQSYNLLRAMLVAGANVKNLKAIFRPVHTNWDIQLTLRPSVTKIRRLESISCLSEKRNGSSTKSIGPPQVTVALDELPNEIPPPGARYWPTGYCYDPLAYLVKHLQNNLGKYCFIHWDRHGGNWIGLTWRESILQSSSLNTFGMESLDGLVIHTDSSQCDSSSGAQLRLTYQLEQLLHLIPIHLHKYIGSVLAVKTGNVLLPPAPALEDSPNTQKTIVNPRKRLKMSANSR